MAENRKQWRQLISFLTPGLGIKLGMLDKDDDDDDDDDDEDDDDDDDDK